MQGNYYTRFGLKEDASLIEIKRAYRKLILAYHPDRNLGRAKYHALTQDINAIYAVLSDPVMKKQYDDELKFTRSQFSTSSFASTDRQTSNQNTYREYETNATESNYNPPAQTGSSIFGNRWVSAPLFGIILHILSSATAPHHTQNLNYDNLYVYKEIKTEYTASAKSSIGDSLFGNMQPCKISNDSVSHNKKVVKRSSKH